jgi:hypothetical protein
MPPVMFLESKGPAGTSMNTTLAPIANSPAQNKLKHFVAADMSTFSVT